VEHQKIIIIIVVLYLSLLWQEVNPHVPVLLKNYPLSNLVNVIRKNLLAEFACLLLLLNWITTVGRQRRQQPRLSHDLTKKDEK
jgi:hypothetical protein